MGPNSVSWAAGIATFSTVVMTLIYYKVAKVLPPSDEMPA